MYIISRYIPFFALHISSPIEDCRRISTLAFVLSTSFSQYVLPLTFPVVRCLHSSSALPTGSCTTVDKILDALFPISVPTFSLLAFFRMRAVFAGNNLMVAFAFSLWLLSFAGTMTMAFGVEVLISVQQIISSYRPPSPTSRYLGCFHSSMIHSSSYQFPGS